MINMKKQMELYTVAQNKFLQKAEWLDTLPFDYFEFCIVRQKDNSAKLIIFKFNSYFK